MKLCWVATAVGVAYLRALTDAGQAGREDLVAGRPERAAHLAETVRATPRAVHQDEDRHLHPSFPPRTAPSAHPTRAGCNLGRAAGRRP